MRPKIHKSEDHLWDKTRKTFTDDASFILKPTSIKLRHNGNLNSVTIAVRKAGCLRNMVGLTIAAFSGRMQVFLTNGQPRFVSRGAVSPQIKYSEVFLFDNQYGGEYVLQFILLHLLQYIK